MSRTKHQADNGYGYNPHQKVSASLSFMCMQASLQAPHGCDVKDTSLDTIGILLCLPALQCSRNPMCSPYEHYNVKPKVSSQCFPASSSVSQVTCQSQRGLSSASCAISGPSEGLQGLQLGLQQEACTISRNTTTAQCMLLAEGRQLLATS